ncbi:MAG: nicotinate-nucleotide diphosphorylase [Phycisphaerales bacterium]|nr:nicotinate-nucleotide diphosphorylase [Phycisphaerales bacterium]
MGLSDLSTLPLDHLFTELVSEAELKRHIDASLSEDCGLDVSALTNAELAVALAAADVTSKYLLMRAAPVVTAALVSRGRGVICGMPLARALVCRMTSPGQSLSLEQYLQDGEAVHAGGVIARVSGDAAVILALERTLLNWLTHLSGVATMTAAFVECVRGTSASIVDSRKTVPGLRALAKYAVRCGGGVPHRLGLHDAVLVKDNHIEMMARGDCPSESGSSLPEGWIDSVRRGCQAARAKGSLRFIEVEADTTSQVRALLGLAPGVIDIIMLDNMTLEEIKSSVALRNACASTAKLEASGGVTMGTVRAIAATGVDRIAVGCITHSAPSLDIGLDFEVATLIPTLTVPPNIGERG